MSADDEAFGRRADVTEGIAGDEGEDVFAGIAEDLRILGFDNGNLVNAIEKCAGECGESDFGAFVNVAKLAEESIAMAGQSNIAGRAEERSANDVSDAALQSLAASSLLNHSLQTNRCDFNSAEWAARGKQRAMRGSVFLQNAARIKKCGH